MPLWEPLAPKQLEDAIFNLREAQARAKEFLADPTQQRAYKINARLGVALQVMINQAKPKNRNFQCAQIVPVWETVCSEATYLTCDLIRAGKNPGFDSWMINGMTVRTTFLNILTGLRDNLDPTADPKKHPLLPLLRERCPNFVRRIDIAYGDALGALGVVIGSFERGRRSEAVDDYWFLVDEPRADL